MSSPTNNDSPEPGYSICQHEDCNVKILPRTAWCPLHRVMHSLEVIGQGSVVGVRANASPVESKQIKVRAKVKINPKKPLEKEQYNFLTHDDSQQGSESTKLDELLVKIYYRGLDRTGYSDYDLKKDKTKLLEWSRQEAERVIGEDDKHPAPGNSEYAQVRNKLRAEQRYRNQSVDVVSLEWCKECARSYRLGEHNHATEVTDPASEPQTEARTSSELQLPQEGTKE